jgi:DNA-binding NtrC family response regulator
MDATNAKPTRLLLVDDEQDLVTYLGQRLEKRGILVHGVTSGPDAVAAARDEIFDVAVIDLQMPHMDGIEVMRQLNTLQPFLQIIMLTGHGSHESAWEAGKLHAFRYLIKPYEFANMLELIEEAHAARLTALGKAFQEKFEELIARNASAREIMTESERLRREYEQD